MDPLSATLAVVTLATAIKDMVEVGQKIHESFAKVSDNLRSAQRVAEDIKEMVEEIRVFYEDNKDMLDNMKDFRSSLQGLLAKFRAFEKSILPLLPQMGVRGRDRLIQGWDAWKNSNKIEGSILEIKGDVMKVIQRHIMKSAMRTEVKLETIQQAINRGLVDVHKGITQGFEGIRRDMPLLQVTTPTTAMTHISYKPSGTSSELEDINRNIIRLAQSTPSTSMPMLRSPDVITEELMTAAYIKLQINGIAAVIEKMSADLVLLAPAPNGVIEFGISPTAEHLSMSIIPLRRQVVRKVTLVRDHLETQRFHTISIQHGAAALHDLSVELTTLDMGYESILVGNWAITLDRILVDTSGDREPHLHADLALHLLNQSIGYENNGDETRSLQAVEEAHTISQTLQNQHGAEANFKILHSQVLLQYARLVDLKRSLDMATEAVQVLETMLNVQVLILSKSHETVQVERIAHSSAFSLDGLSSPASLITVTTFAQALQDLATYLFIDGHHKSAADLVLLAISLRRKIVSIHGHVYRVDLALDLSSLVQGGTASCIPADELVNLADECVQLLRELADKNPVFYARKLVNVLCKKASTLESLDRNMEAITTWEEVASLAGQIIQDSAMCAHALHSLTAHFRHLKRYEDAVKTGMLAINTYNGDAAIDAQRYFCLSNDLLELQKYKESADATRSSIKLYQRLAMGDPDPCLWMPSLALDVARLAHCLAALGDYPGALIAWKESVSMLDNFANSDLVTTSSDILDWYLLALDAHEWISLILEDDEKCLQICTTTVKYRRQFQENYPPHEGIPCVLYPTEFRYAYNMLRLGRLEDGQQYIDHWTDTWSSQQEPISESVDATSYRTMMSLKADMLDAQGFVEEALLVNRKTYNRVQDARLCLRLGDNDGALQVAEAGLQLSRDGGLIRSLVLSLHTVSLTALSCQNYKRAVEAAREGCKISANPDWAPTTSNSESADVFIRPDLLAILSSAEANLGRCGSALEYAHCAVEASLDIGNMKSFISATTATHSYMETRGNLAEILLATGDPAQALQICEERRAYFSKRVEKRMGEYRDLAPILRMLGVLCCSEGRHEEGEAAAKELSRIVKMLGSAFPSLQQQVKIRLRSQAKVPILQVLDDMVQKLDCRHQAEVVLLFAI